MMILVTYDVSTQDETSAKRLRHVARQCQNYGQRVQYSVFECLLDPVQWSELKFELEKAIDGQKDSLRYYFLGANWQKRVGHSGAKSPYNPQGLLLL